MKKIINKLKNPELFYKKEMPTNFLNEIYNGKENNKVTKDYLKSFSAERLETERQQKKTDRALNIHIAIFILIVVSLITLAVLRENENKEQVAIRELSIKLLTNK